MGLPFYTRNNRASRVEIPPQQEFEPGTHQCLNGQTIMNIEHNVSISKTPTTVPHRYQFVLDVPRIHRLLRPLKAKIQAIEIAIKSAPSYGYTVNNSNNNNAYRNESSRNNIRAAHENTFNRMEQFQYQEGRDSRSRQGRTLQYFGRRYIGPACGHSNGPLPNTNASITNGRDLLISRFQSSLTDVFKDLFDKYWWQPICDDYDLPLNSSLSKVLSNGIKPSQYTLGMMCAFTVGRIVSSLPRDKEYLVDKYYDIMPDSMRRFALLEHAVGICTTLVPIVDMLKPLVEVCVRYRADAQALRFLEHLLLNQDASFQLDYRWAYIVASRIESAETWVRIWAQKAPVSFFTSRLFSTLTKELPQHGATLIQASIWIHMDAVKTGLSEKTRHVQSIKLATTLIEESLKLHERIAEGHDTMLQSALLNRLQKYNGGIEQLSRSLFEEYHLEPGTWQKSVALALALHSLYSAVTTLPESTALSDGTSSWIELLERRASPGICEQDFNVVVEAYGTLTNLSALAHMLDAVGLYSLAMTLIEAMLIDYYTLEEATRRQLGYSCDVSVSSLESFLKEVNQRRLQRHSNDGWEYDEVMETWVEVSPKADKTVAIPIDDFIKTNSYDIEGEEPNFHPTSPLRHHRNSNDSSSRQATKSLPPEQKRQPAKKPAPPPIDHSPFVMRRPIRYSMTPMRRSSRKTRRLISYDDKYSGSESELNDDEGVYVAPMDLEILAKFAIEDDSETENRSTHEILSESESEIRSGSGLESEDNFTENTAQDVMSNRSSSIASDSELSIEGDNDFKDTKLHNYCDIADVEDSDIGGERLVTVRPSRRQLRYNRHISRISPEVIVLSDSIEENYNDQQDSDRDGSFDRFDTESSIESDRDSLSGENNKHKSVLMTKPRKVRRHKFSVNRIEDSGSEEDDPGDFYGQESEMSSNSNSIDVYVISDDDIKPREEPDSDTSQEPKDISRFFAYGVQGPKAD
ncbi:hypothetical protein FBU30_005860 [Linnemannia zychae]|nr:hypothetical protein FBU30_005860 [Linnemannia zychae]